MEFEMPNILPAKITKSAYMEESDDMDRRKFLKTTSVVAGGIILGQSILAENATAALSAPPIEGVTQGDNGAISFTWGAVTGAEGYKLYIGTSSGNYLQTVDLGNVTTKVYTALEPNSYYMAVAAYAASTGALGGVEESQKSSELNIIIGISPPSGLTSTVVGSAVYFVWSEVTGVSGYKLYYGTRSRSYTGSVDLENVTSISFSGMRSGTYYVALSSYISSVEGGLSKEMVVVVR